MANFHFPLAKSVVMTQLHKPEVKRLIVDILQRIVKDTDNDLDDVFVLKIKKALLSPGDN